MILELTRYNLQYKNILFPCLLHGSSAGDNEDFLFGACSFLNGKSKRTLISYQDCFSVCMEMDLTICGRNIIKSRNQGNFFVLVQHRVVQ